MKENENNFGNRLKLARKMAGMSLQDLSDSVSSIVTKQALSRYEQNEMKPTTPVLLAIAKALGVKSDFFLKQSTVELGEILYRKQVALSKKDEDAVIEQVRDYVERYLELEEILAIPNFFINPLKDFPINRKNDVEAAANRLREEWKLGEKPIANVVEMLEMRGIKVVLLEVVDAFDGLAAFTSTGVPIVVVNKKGKSIERLRFTVVHELAHLLLNLTNIKNDHKGEEEWCHFFASCFLMPTLLLVRMIGGGKRTYIQINELQNINAYFGISIRAIVHRLKTLNIITENYYTRWIVYMSKTFGSKSEPGKYVGQEESKGFSLMIARALSEGIISLSKAAALTNSDISQIRKDYVTVS